MIEDVPCKGTTTKALSHVFSGILYKTGVEIDYAVKKDVHAVCPSCPNLKLASDTPSVSSIN
jgi:hypothetical protein